MMLHEPTKNIKLLLQCERKLLLIDDIYMPNNKYLNIYKYWNTHMCKIYNL